MTKVALALLFGLITAVGAEAQQYPTQTVTVICPFPPGSASDVFVRFMAAKLSERLHQTFVVENRVGAQGNIATEAVARAKPDGYTVAITPATSTMAAATSLFKKLPFDPVKDFVPVTTLAKYAFVIFIDGQSPVKSLQELTESLRKKKQHGFYGTSGNTSTVAIELYKIAAGLSTERVNYKSGQEIIRDMRAGQIDIGSLDPGNIIEFIKRGELKALATTGDKRVSVLPDVPTLAESGYSGIDLTSWWGVFVPANTPGNVVDVLHKAANDVVRSPEGQNFLRSISIEPFPGDPATVSTLLKRDIERWGQYITTTKIEKQ